MPSSSCLDYLLDIRDNALLAQRWTAGYTRETFAENQQVFYAATRCLEIVSEAARRLPQELRDNHPELPWRAIMDAGNVYRHGYDYVAENAVWHTVQHSLPPLLAVVESELANITAFATQELTPSPEPPQPRPDEPDTEP
jgi:uncharacterized protein with HEPN domain